MSFVHPALLLGLGLVIIPLLLHLLMRARPKKMIFPAMRLLQQRRQTNSRRMRLKHFWLLLLRMLVVAGLVLAITRPTLPPANYAPTWGEGLTAVALVLLAVVVYFGLRHWWRRQRLARSEQATREWTARSGLIALAALLLLLLVAWPYQRRVAAEITAPVPAANLSLPVASVFLFDTSLSMEYQQEGKTRLDVARQMAANHLSRLPGGSKVAVQSSAQTTPPLFIQDLATAANRLDAVTISARNRPLNDALRTALVLHEDDRKRIVEQAAGSGAGQDRFLREIYLFTDLSKSGWRLEGSETLRQRLEQLADIGLYLIDTGAESPTNAGLYSVRLSRPTAVEGGQIVIEAALRTTGAAVREPQTVELFLKDEGGKLSKHGQVAITPSPDADSDVRLLVQNLTGRFRQGVLRLTSRDPLAADDTAGVTIPIHPAPLVLVVAPSREVAGLWIEALAPSELAKLGRVRYTPQFTTPDRLNSVDFSKVNVAFLLNVTRLDDAQWQRLAGFVREGGGLGVFTGDFSAIKADGTRRSRGIDPLNYNASAAQAVLPAKLSAALRFQAPVALDLERTSQSLLQALEQTGAIPELANVPFARYWKVEPSSDSTIIARYLDEPRSPAVLERTVGKGRTVLVTSSVDSIAWNEWPRSWSFIAFADQLVEYLSTRATERANFTLGESVRLTLPGAVATTEFLLRAPDFRQVPVAREKDGGVVLPPLDTPGNYDLAPAATPTTAVAGVSVTLPPGETDLTRLSSTELDPLLGEGRYTIDRDPASLQRRVNFGRLGQEVYGLLMAGLIGFFVVEHLVANWFYRADQTASADESLASKRRSAVVGSSATPPTAGSPA